MRITWTSDARRDLARQIDHIAQDNPHAALRQDEAVISAVRRLAEFPASGRPGRVGGTRELVVTGTPFVVIYRLAESEVLIARVMHGAQRWPDAS